jgi:LacI family transcriptional regulator
MSITIRKIAKDLNLAVSTVSKALRDSYEIGEETKRLVLDYARKMEYIPNPYAGSLKNRRTGNIAVVVPEVADSFFSNAINGIDSVAQEKGFHVIVYLTHENADREAAILDGLRGGRVDGILISVSGGSGRDKSVYTQLLKEIPVIFFDRVWEDVPAAKVVTDDFDAAYNATIHLLEQRCKNVVFVSASGELSIVDERRKGFMKAVADNGFNLDDCHVLHGSHNEEESLTAITDFIRIHDGPIGVLASVEKHAMQVYVACQVCDRKIPDDVKLVAFSNLHIAPLLRPSLTTILQPAFQMGHTAATLLFKSLTKKNDITHERVVLPSRLNKRGSTGRNENDPSLPK